MRAISVGSSGPATWSLMPMELSARGAAFLEHARELLEVHDRALAAFAGREAAKLGDADERPDGIQVEGAIDHFHTLLLISTAIAC
jgi:DNA-binding transcriptional LysR family regulator